MAPMSTWNGIYLRGNIPEQAAALFEGRVLGARGRVMHRDERRAIGDAAARMISEQVEDEVIWILIQTTASALGIVHYQAARWCAHSRMPTGVWGRRDQIGRWFF